MSLYEKDNKPTSMKFGFKTDKIVTKLTETGHTFTTEGRIFHKNIDSDPLKFQTSRNPDQPRKSINSCRRCGKFSSGEYCETHRRLMVEKSANNAEARDEARPSYFVLLLMVVYFFWCYYSQLLKAAKRQAS